MRRRDPHAALAFLLVGLSLGACVSPVRTRPEPPRDPRGREAVAARTAPTVAGRVALARSLLGSAYRYGGDTPRGFDCSGFARYVFTAGGVELPRTTEEQAEAGHWVPLDELEAGDLVFFSEVGGKPHHVGIVVSGPGEPLRMIHASTSRGVVETDVLNGSYWLRRLSFGRRIEG